MIWKKEEKAKGTRQYCTRRNDEKWQETALAPLSTNWIEGLKVNGGTTQCYLVCGKHCTSQIKSVFLKPRCFLFNWWLLLQHIVSLVNSVWQVHFGCYDIRLLINISTGNMNGVFTFYRNHIVEINGQRTQANKPSCLNQRPSLSGRGFRQKHRLQLYLRASEALSILQQSLSS